MSSFLFLGSRVSLSILCGWSFSDQKYCVRPLSQRPVGFYCTQRLQFFENPQLLPSQKLELHSQEDLLATPQTFINKL